MLKSGTKAVPIVGPREKPKTLRIDDPRRESKIGEDILDHDLDEGEVYNPMNRAKILTGQQTHRDLAEAQMEGGFAHGGYGFSGYGSGYGYSPNASGSSNQVQSAPEPLDCAPPQTIRVVRFPKDDIEPSFVWRQTVDVKADRHHGDAKLNHIPNFREDWGPNANWKVYRMAYRVFVAPEDIQEEKLHGRYFIFVTRDPGYEKSTHKLTGGYRRHIHEDLFIAKVGTYPDRNGWTNYVNVPDEFLSATTKDGRKLYGCRLAETKRSMIESILG